MCAIGNSQYNMKVIINFINRHNFHLTKCIELMEVQTVKAMIKFNSYLDRPACLTT